MAGPTGAPERISQCCYQHALTPGAVFCGECGKASGQVILTQKMVERLEAGEALHQCGLAGEAGVEACTGLATHGEAAVGQVPRRPRSWCGKRRGRAGAGGAGR